jgi:hypothetical protein
MQKKNLIKSSSLVAVLAVATLFGFFEAYGYGGGGGGFYGTPCSSVVYGNWGSCVNGSQHRNVDNIAPVNCILTAGQQLERSRYCEIAVIAKEDDVKQPIPAVVVTPKAQVLNIVNYADGTLLRGVNKKIYVVVDGRLQYIATLAELARHRGRILNISDDVISSYAKKAVLGAKVYADGTILRVKGDVKIYVMKDGKKVHIKNLAELRKQKGKSVVISAAELNNL